MSLMDRLRRYPGYVVDLLRYVRSPGAEPWASFSLRPMLEDKTPTTGFDAHYVYLGAWAFRHIVAHRPARHVDVGAQIGWVTCLASITKVVFIDVRPFAGSVENLESRAGSILALPFGDRELDSLSCLHVAEHIGLGRYGDAIDPLGTRKAVRELARVLAAGGRLYFALPIGRPSVVFNAHRVHDPETIVQSFGEEGLQLEQFAAVDDAGRFSSRAEPRDYRSQRYACGMFLIRR
jgi:SAM-dependent methyltransferase